MICSRKMMLAMLLATAVSAMKNVRPADRIRGMRSRRRLNYDFVLKDKIQKKKDEIANYLKRTPTDPIEYKEHLVEFGKTYKELSKLRYRDLSSQIRDRKTDLKVEIRTKNSQITDSLNKKLDLEDASGLKKSRVELGKAYEECFQLKVKDMSLRLKTKEIKDTTLFKQEWEGSSVKNKNSLRVLQFNILAHGLSSETSGFAANYKSGLTVKDIKDAQKNGTEYLLPKEMRELLFSETAEHEIETETTESETKVTNIIDKEGNLLEGKGTKTVKLFPFPERLKRVVGLILKQNPDVITLEEVDRFDAIRDILNKMGYEGCIQRKPSGGAADGYNAPNNGKLNSKKKISNPKGISDGVAIFWNTARLMNTQGGNIPYKNGRLHKEDTVKVLDPETKTFVTDEEQNLEILKRLETQKRGSRCTVDGKTYKLVEGKDASQVYIMAKLKFKDPTASQRPFVVVCAHLKSGKKPGDQPSKRAQAREIGKLIQDVGKENIPVIFGSDFNNAKGDTGFDTFYPDKGVSRSTWAKKHLTSAYKLEAFEQAKDKKGEPIWITKSNRDGTEYRLKMYARDPSKQYTVVKQRKAGSQKSKIEDTPEVQTIDFIFYSSKYFTKKATLNMPTFGDVERLSEGQYLPCWKYPSDHFMIGADLELMPEIDDMRQKWLADESQWFGTSN